jgi:hypothetical protein
VIAATASGTDRARILARCFHADEDAGPRPQSSMSLTTIPVVSAPAPASLRGFLVAFLAALLAGGALLGALLLIARLTA